MAVQSVERAFKILEMLYENKNPHDGIGIMAVSKELDLKLPTVHNLMKTLVELGYAEQKEDGKYRPGPKADKFGMKSDSMLLNIARPHIKNLVRELNETAVLIVRHDGIRYTLHQEECERELKVSSDNSPNSNFCGTATGLAILSAFSDNQLDRYIANASPDFTGHFKDGKDLKRTLEQIRKDGYYVWEKEEFVVFGVPLAEPHSGLFASLGVFVPMTRYNPQIRRKIITAMKAAAEAVLLCIK